MANSIKHTVLENVVHVISDLRTVKTQAAQFRAQIGTNLIYEKYYTLILSVAQVYDDQQATKANLRGTRFSMHNSELHTHIPTEYDFDDSYNIDSSISQLNINDVDNDYNSGININNVKTDYNSESG